MGPFLIGDDKPSQYFGAIFNNKEMESIFLFPITGGNPMAEKGCIALQGSFGHEIHALGIMSGMLEEFNRQIKNPKVNFVAGSSTVEMLVPMLLFFNSKSKVKPDNYQTIIEEHFKTEEANIFKYFSNMTWNSRILAKCDPIEYWEQVMESIRTHPYSPMLLLHFLPSGVFEFNHTFIESMRNALTQLFSGIQTDKVVFTNMSNYKTLEETYLYCGTLSPKEKTVMQGKPVKRNVLPLNVDNFFASGARIPYFLPAPLGKDYYMEGALLCNPPLSPFIDLKSKPNKILLIRFFQKKMKKLREIKGSDLMERYLEVNFTAPLEKELYTIGKINEMVKRCPGLKVEDKEDRQKAYRQISIFDPANDDPINETAPLDLRRGIKEFQKLVDTLDAFSHYDQAYYFKLETMFDEGAIIGKGIFNYYDYFNWQ